MSNFSRNQEQECPELCCPKELKTTEVSQNNTNLHNHSSPPTPTNNKAFTLVELMIVVAILGILAAIAIPQYASYIESTNTAGVNQSLNTVLNAYQACVPVEGRATCQSDTVNNTVNLKGFALKTAPNGHNTGAGGAVACWSIEKTSDTDYNGCIQISSNGTEINRVVSVPLGGTCSTAAHATPGTAAQVPGTSCTGPASITYTCRDGCTSNGAGAVSQLCTSGVYAAVPAPPGTFSCQGITTQAGTIACNTGVCQ